MHFIYYPALILLLFFGAHFCKKGEWNEEVLSFGHTKAFLGFCAVVIMMHHISQRTCAPWLSPVRIHHGLDLFVFVGYLCVAAFFFCSGYGLYTASHTKEDFFDRYLTRRIMPILTPTLVMWLVFFVIERVKKMEVPGPLWINTYDYIWYIPAILYMYGFFWISFRLIKKEKLSFAVLTFGTLLHFVLCLLFSPGTWWYNSPFVFLIGAVCAKRKDAFLASLKKWYPLKLFLSVIITLAGFVFANYYGFVIGVLGWKYTDVGHFWGELIGQLISAAAFVFCMILIGMKIRIGNRALKFLGSFTLEFYLVHPLFVQLFGFAFMYDHVKPLYHIQNQFLYVLVVFVLSLPLAYGLHKLVTLIWKRPRK